MLETVRVGLSLSLIFTPIYGVLTNIVSYNIILQMGEERL
jgi:hypothetical protein